MRFNPLRNILLKVSALALALLLWVHVATNKLYEYQLDLPLKLVNIPRGLVMVSDLPREVSVKVKATGKQLLALSTRDPVITINAAEFKAGAVEKTITNGEISAALDRSFESVEVFFPKTLVLRFEREAERKIEVHSAVKAEAANGYALASDPRIEPESVSVNGPTSALRLIKYLETEQEHFDGLTASAYQKVKLSLPDSLHLTLKDSMVTVLIEVEPRKQKTFANVVVTPPLNFNASRYNVVPSRLSLVLGIPQSKLDSVTDADITLTFKRPRLLKDTVKAEIEYLLPSYVEIIGVHPDSVLIIRKS